MIVMNNNDVSFFKKQNYMFLTHLNCMILLKKQHICNGVHYGPTEQLAS